MTRLIRRTLTAWTAWRARRALSHVRAWAEADRQVSEARRRHGRVSEALRAKQSALHENMRGA